VALLDELIANRLFRIHDKFLAAAEKYPTLGHVACRSDTERLTLAMQPKHSPLTDFLSYEEQEQLFRWFWGDATWYGAYGRFSYFVGTPQRIYCRSNLWVGRYADVNENESEITEVLEDASNEFIALSQEATDHFSNVNHPPIHVDLEGAFPIIVNPWLNKLYALFDPAPEMNEGPEFVQLRLEPGESFEIIGLPCNVFLASARAIEMLAKHKVDDLIPLWPSSADVVYGPPTPQDPKAERTADTNADRQEIVVPKNPKVIQLAHKIHQAGSKGKSQREIALEFTEGDEQQADSLLRQVRRFPHLSGARKSSCPRGQSL